MHVQADDRLGDLKESHLVLPGTLLLTPGDQLKIIDMFSKANVIVIIRVSNSNWTKIHLDNNKNSLTYHDSVHFDGF